MSLSKELDSTEFIRVDSRDTSESNMEGSLNARLSRLLSEKVVKFNLPEDESLTLKPSYSRKNF